MLVTCPADHKHGEVWTCFSNHGCRCSDCCVAARARRQRQYRLRGYGIAPKYVSTEPMRKHLAWLSRHGTGPIEAATLAGINPASVKYANDQGRTVREDIAAAILTITPDQSGRARNVATRRRIHGLMRIGYSQQRIADEADTQQNLLSLISNGKTCSTARDLHDRIQAATERLVALDAGADWLKAKARRDGLAPLWAWDNISDPTEKPKGVKAA